MFSNIILYIYFILVGNIKRVYYAYSKNTKLKSLIEKSLFFTLLLLFIKNQLLVLVYIKHIFIIIFIIL